MTDTAGVLAGRSWWHTIDVAPGVTTAGAWDIRHLPGLIPWPDRMGGLRCLDVGTADGFWAFEMERRGAGEVLALDTAERGRDVPPHLRRSQSGHPDARPPGDNFRVLARLLGSRAEFRCLNAYDLT